MKSTANLDAYEILQEAMTYQAMPYLKSDLAKARTLFEEAIAIDAGLPFEEAREKRTGYPRAWSRMAYTLVGGMAEKLVDNKDIPQALADAEEFASIALELDSSDYDNHWGASYLYMCTNRIPEGLKALEHAWKLNPARVDLQVDLAEALTYAGQAQTALGLFNQAAHTKDWHRWVFAWIFYFEGMKVEPDGDPKLIAQVLARYQAALDSLDQMNCKKRDHPWQGRGSASEDDRCFIFDTLLVRAAIHARRAKYCAVIDCAQVGGEQDLMAQAMEEFKVRKKSWIGRPFTLDDKKYAIRDTSPNGIAHPLYSHEPTREYWLEGCRMAGLS